MDINLILNKVSNNNFAYIHINLTKLLETIDDDEYLEYIFDVLLQNSIKQPVFCKYYVKLLDLINMPNVKVVYDTGNRVAFGHDLAGDIRLLGDAIGHVHIKDKNNANVLLGTGLVNFENVFYALNDVGYSGPYTFETTRGSNPVSTAKYNMNLVNFFKDNAENA